MADIKNLEERVEKAQARVEKCKGTIERHKKALDKKIQAVIKAVGLDLTGKTEAEIEELRAPYRSTNDSWRIYEVSRKLDDIKGATKKLAEAEEVLGNWKEKLSVEVNNEKFLEDNAPQVIKDFLNDWKQMSYEWHIKRYNDYQVFKEKIEKEEQEAYDELGIQKYRTPSREQSKILKEKGLDYRSIQDRKSNFAGGAVLHMDGIYKEAERLAWLEKTLERERKAKMLDLIHRISKVVGEITDASYLEINQKGNIDGYVIGTDGEAWVNTIGAGGYAIQCFHYRTLVKPKK